MLLKNVLKGLKKEFDIERLSIIQVKSENDYKVCFTGTLENFNQAENIGMFDYKKSLLNSEVVTRDNIAGTNHFIFIK